MSTRDDNKQRPDDRLVLANQVGRGRLKIFLGMAPGVGKTYAMLDSARRLSAQGVDVVAGIIETHGRAETKALCESLETLPRRTLVYRGQNLEEFDIDAALARKPTLLLVDELAHTNAPDCRHPKRWQDVYELLDAGIDVHTTLNVQHLESLSDVVARITGVRVAETVPDTVFESADEISVIDVTPQDLLARLADGKIYAAPMAARARENFFKPGNLTALRELALRRVAERVDHQLVGYMQANSIEGPWPTSERIMALVGPDGLGSSVVRAANRIADQLKAPFIAVTVENPEKLRSPAKESGIDEALALAGRLSGRVERLTSQDLPGEILSYARKNNVTQIFIGRAKSRRWREITGKSLVIELIRRAEGVAVHVVSEIGDAIKPAAKTTKTETTSAAQPLDPLFWPIHYWRKIVPFFSGLAAVGLMILLCLLVRGLATGANVAMLFLAAVLFSAVSHGVRPAIVTALAAFFSYNFFFTEPLYSLAVREWHDLLAMFVFLTVAITTGTLAGRVRNQALAARARMIALSTLYDFSKRLGSKTSIDELGHAVVLQIHRLTENPGVLLLPQADNLAVSYAWPPDDQLPERDFAAARWAFSHGEATGAGTGTLPSSQWHFRPLKAAGVTRGVFGLQTKSAPRGDVLETIDSVLDQGAIAIERINFAAGAANVHALTETDKLRSALLSSISHDLRTPLTSVLGAASTLRHDYDTLDAAQRSDLLSTIEDEAQRLDRFVENLLDMTQLEAGVLSPKKEWLDLEDTINNALRRLTRELQARHVIRSFSPDLPPVLADSVLLETVLINLLDNAAKHTNGSVEISATHEDMLAVISVTDDGRGISPGRIERVFEKFYRGEDETRAGVGLGLSICKGLVEAMGGQLSVESPVAEGKGTRFTVKLKMAAPSGKPLHE